MRCVDRRTRGRRDRAGSPGPLRCSMTSTRTLLLLAAAATPASCSRLPPLDPLDSVLSFELGGVASSAFLSTWQRTARTYPVRDGGAGLGGTRTRTVFFQPLPCDDWARCPVPGPNGPGCSSLGGEGCKSFGLQLIVVNTSYGGVRGAHAATEWTAEFRNTAPITSSLPLCHVRTLDARLPLPAVANLTIEFRAGCSAVTPEHPQQGRQPGDGPAPGPNCPHGAVDLPAKLLTAGRPLACTGTGGCQPNQFHPQLATFPAGSVFELGDRAGNTTGGGNTGSPSGANGGLPFFSAWTTTGQEGTSRQYSGITVSVGFGPVTGVGSWRAPLPRACTSASASPTFATRSNLGRPSSSHACWWSNGLETSHRSARMPTVALWSTTRSLAIQAGLLWG